MGALGLGEINLIFGFWNSFLKWIRELFFFLGGEPFLVRIPENQENLPGRFFSRENVSDSIGEWRKRKRFKHKLVTLSQKQTTLEPWRRSVFLFKFGFIFRFPEVFGGAVPMILSYLLEICCFFSPIFIRWLGWWGVEVRGDFFRLFEV